MIECVYENMMHLYQKVTQLKVLELFLSNPYEEYYLRETARTLDMDAMTVKRSLDLLVDDGLLMKFKQKNMILYKANLENKACRFQKISYNLSWLNDKKLVDLVDSSSSGSSSMVLFGSYAKGENDHESDIDVVLIASKFKDISQKLRKAMGKEVNVVSFTPAQWSKQAKQNPAFYLDVITDGIALKGRIPVV